MILTKAQKQKIANKRVNAAKEGICFRLTAAEVVQLLTDAGITFDDWGFSTGAKYVLARHNDAGAYEVGNCLFITQRENAAEKVVTDKAREASRANIILFNASADATSKRCSGCAAYRARTKHLRVAAAESAARIAYDKAHPSYRGARNSQFGTVWIYRGSTSKKIMCAELSAHIERGWRRGRKPK